MMRLFIGKVDHITSIGVLPFQIAENGIIVASSNNGAVKNIVDELPLITEIDESLVDELKKWIILKIYQTLKF